MGVICEKQRKASGEAMIRAMKAPMRDVIIQTGGIIKSTFIIWVIVMKQTEYNIKTLQMS